MRTIDNIKHNTFQEASGAKGILASNDVYEKSLGEVVLYKFPRELRELFAYLLSFHTTCNAQMLWEKFKDDLMEDYLRLRQQHIFFPYIKYQTHVFLKVIFFHR